MISGQTEPAAQHHHRFSVRVYYEDTDAVGIVYYANYLKFAERARTEMLCNIGADFKLMGGQLGLAFVVQRCLANYRRPARLHDLLDVRTLIVRVGAASLTLRQEVFCNDTLCVAMDVRLALVDRELKPARLPPALIAALTPQYKVGT